jgi:DNA-binding NarL/FixJ family response regulator
MREGLRTLISRERDLIVCGEGGDSRQALDVVANLKPDIVLADITLPGPNGIELTGVGRTHLPERPGMGSLSAYRTRQKHRPNRGGTPLLHLSPRPASRKASACSVIALRK